jgi:hypothetical protein
MTPEVEEQYGISKETVESFVVGELGYSAHACPAATELTVYVSPDK